MKAHVHDGNWLHDAVRGAGDAVTAVVGHAEQSIAKGPVGAGGDLVDHAKRNITKASRALGFEEKPKYQTSSDRLREQVQKEARRDARQVDRHKAEAAETKRVEESLEAWEVRKFEHAKDTSRRATKGRENAAHRVHAAHSTGKGNAHCQINSMQQPRVNGNVSKKHKPKNHGGWGS